MASSLRVNIRMYRVGELGDCFLLTFKQGRKSSNVLIDCGSFRNSNSSKEQLRKIVTHIGDTLKGKKLDVVAGTHQHNDHFSGFAHADDILKNIGAENVWLSWLDDDSDPEAGKIRKQQKKLIGLVDNIHQKIKLRLNASPSEELRQTEEHIGDILQFYGLGSGPAVPEQGLEVLKQLTPKGLAFLSPGDILDLPGLDPGAVKVYVLGPPKDYKKIKDVSANEDESYDHSLAMANFNGENLAAALSEGQERQQEYPFEDHFPFNAQYKIFSNREESAGDFERFRQTAVFQHYSSPENEWRQIDNEWLDPSGALALYLNSYTNNSSLVLAFELVKSKKILLFVGDAQTGNWLSWDDIKWPGGATTADMLKRVVLYKVGHHASHNATLKDAFEHMTHKDLAAMIPVDETDPNITKKNGWKMPAHNLYNRILEKTNFKVLRMDQGIPPECKGKNKTWERSVKINELYIELPVKG